MRALDGLESHETALRPVPTGNGRFASAYKDRVHSAAAESASETSRRENLYRRSLAIADVFAAAMIILVVLPWEAHGTPRAVVVAAMVLMLFINKVCGLYERDELVLNKTTLEEVPSLLQVGGLFALAVWLFHDGATPVELDATDIMVIWASSFSLLVSGRAFARALVERFAETERCLVIGDEESIGLVYDKIEGGRANAVVVGSLCLDDCHKLSTTELSWHVDALVRRYGVHRAIIAPSTGGAETLELVRIAKHAGISVSVLPRLLEVVGSSVEFDQLDGLTMLGIRRFGLARSSRWLKRGFDIVGSTLLLLAVSPFLLAIAIAIRLETPGPAFFRQTRVGRDGVRFKMLKFRSMEAGAEAKKDSLRHLNEMEGLFKIADDPRVTRMGRFLRRTALDELPQLINVWRGEMSLVGPRPLVTEEDEQVQGFDRHRLHLTPGMTGHWQIMGSGRIPMHEMVTIDYLYVANWSLWTDVKILLRTIPYVLASRGM